jgi:hypothetical protein
MVLRLRVHNSSGICLVQPLDLASSAAFLPMRRLMLDSGTPHPLLAYIGTHA